MRIRVPKTEPRCEKSHPCFVRIALEVVLESRTKSQGFKVLENHDLLAKHVVLDDSEKFEISYFGTTFQNDL